GIAVLAALCRKQLGAAMLLSTAAVLSVRHIRFQALFAVVLVIVGGAVLASAWESLQKYIEGARIRTAIAATAMLLTIALAGVRSFDLVTDRTYLGTTDLGSFGTGLSWWFPEGAAAFVEREKLPGRMFNSYNEGGYLTWRLGEHYQDYIDGRAIPFGTHLFQRNGQLLGTLPDSPDWQNEAERYGINFILVPLGRYNALQFFPVLRQFCQSDSWRPVYLDEVSAVFLRRTPQTENLMARLAIDCETAPITPNLPNARDGNAFHRWANAAAVLQALGRNEESLQATTKALGIFPDTAFVHFLRGNLLRDARNIREAEEQYRLAASLEGNAATWSALADLYQAEGRREEEIHAREQAVALLAKPGVALLSLGYTYLDVRRPEDALHAFARAESSVSPGQADASYLANLAHGRALAWMALGNLSRAISFEEETVRLTPDRIDDWLQLAEMYEHDQRTQDAQAARNRAYSLRTRTP
ncbi:MAG TPA: tetratricopeptide repeat protein, partial [Terriglobales bacterium]|nr:tetratricopeptide repeat protein [Terriglobales bacterium]